MFIFHSSTLVDEDKISLHSEGPSTGTLAATAIVPHTVAPPPQPVKTARKKLVHDYLCLIGIGGSTRLRSCHTSRHAGPHRAVREVEVMRVEGSVARQSGELSPCFPGTIQPERDPKSD